MKSARCPWCGHDVNGCGKRCPNCRAVVYCRDEPDEPSNSKDDDE